MERISRFRAVLFLVLFAFVLLLYAGKLFSLQIIETDGNTDNTQTYTTLTTVRAARGDILDRNGNVLVGNRASYDLVFNHYVIKSNDNTNEALYNLVQKCKELGITYNDHFPVTTTRPFEYTLTDFNTSWQNNFQLFMMDISLDSDITAPLLVERMRSRYDIPESWSDEDARAVIGFRYEFDLRGITNLPTYTFLEDVSDEQLSAILELNTPGLMVESSTVREYHTKYAAHVLGYLGGMTSDQWNEYKQEGYSMDALVGQSGFERAFEDYLHGIDGTRVDIVNKDGAIINQYYAKEKDADGNITVKEPVAGNNVETTIDITIQQVAEDALEEVMLRITNPEINTAEGDKEGLDAQGAAVIVMECKTGNILACASYPTYDLANMTDPEVWAEINSNELNPLFNRAFGAEYPPGSTFKMCTLISAMENKSSDTHDFLLKYGETIVDQGVFTKYEGFAPTCLAWTSGKFTHGEIDGTLALCYSCNYFFYELGSRNNEENMANTAEALGLGVPTGIELTEEKTGRVNTAEVKKQVYGNSGVNSSFTAGDRVLGAIGQGENRFTPLQLCVYASTLANKGTRMKATFLSRVVSSDYRTLIKESQPQIMNQLEMAGTTIETYWQGMRKVVTTPGGTADAYFGGPDDTLDSLNGVWPMAKEITVYAKTGTAEHASGGSDHGAFICFAHRSDETEPDIAIAIYGEKIAHGSSLAPVAEQILMAYYEMDDASEVTAFENQAG